MSQLAQEKEETKDETEVGAPIAEVEAPIPEAQTTLSSDLEATA